jgi:SsrA-binding protein
MKSVTIVNKSASHEFLLLDRFVAGIVLAGWEVKSLRLGRAQLKDSFVKILQGEAYLVNATIQAYAFSRDDNPVDPKRSRKLLLHKRELAKLAIDLDRKRMTLVPTKLFMQRNHFKLEVALARGKKTYEKREALKQRDIERETARGLKRSIRF